VQVIRPLTSETTEERQARTELESIEQLREQQTETNRRVAELESRRDRLPTQEYQQQRNDLTEQLQVITQRLEEAQVRYQQIPADVRFSSQAREENLRRNVVWGVKYSLYFLILVILSLI
jgi:hypothetical protein